MNPSRFIFILCLLFSFDSQAATETIAQGSSLCDASGIVCMNGKITYSRGEKSISINGRLRKTHGPGLLSFQLQGITPIKEIIVHAVDFDIEGKYSEIIRTKFRPPLSSQTEWSLKEIIFIPNRP